MKTPLFFALLVLVATFGFSQENNAHRTQIYGGFSAGSLMSGKQYDLLHDALQPQPSQYSYMAPTLGLRHYVFPFLGFEANGDVYGNVTVSGKGANPLESYLISSFQSGLLFRYVFDAAKENSIEVYAGAGGNFTWLQYSPKFKAVFPSGFVFYDVSPGWGFYGKVGACYYLVGPFFVDAQVEYAMAQTHIAVSDSLFGGNYLKTNIHVGLAF